MCTKLQNTFVQIAKYICPNFKSLESDDDDGGYDVDDDAKCGGKLSGRMYSLPLTEARVS